MENQKIENLLQLAIDVEPSERERSEVLQVGYDIEERLWTLIVRYYGDLREITGRGWDVIPLSGGYAVVRILQKQIAELSEIPEVEYIEKPKRVYFSLDRGRSVSCVSSIQNNINDVVQNGSPSLDGLGTIVAVIDSGVDYFHPDFRNADGTTRILSILDQTYRGGGAIEREYTAEEINRALLAGSPEMSFEIVPVQDSSGHGTSVLGIAAGNGAASSGRYRGIAPKSDIIVVKLGIPERDGFPSTTEVMRGIEYVIRKAQEQNRPVAVNLSFGNVYGSHRGDSLLEEYLTYMAGQFRNSIVVGTGNEGVAAGHVSGVLQDPSDSEFELERIEFQIDNYELSLDIQIWKNYVDDFDIFVYHPDGRRIGPLNGTMGTSKYRLGNMDLLVYYGEPSPYQIEQEIFLDFISESGYLDSGNYQIELVPQRVISGRYDMWMSDSRVRSPGTRFLTPSPNVTLTVPSTARGVISVGAYDARMSSYASFSGRGWETEQWRNCPDICAPGVAVTTTAPGGGYASVSGTSFAAPFVTGSAALLMQWGIMNGNDPYLYGEKVKAYLQKGARQLPGYERWPNNLVGYGALCVRNSLP